MKIESTRRIKFKVDTEHGEYNDALYFTDLEFSTLSESQIQRMCESRVNNWKNSIKAQNIINNDPIKQKEIAEQIKEEHKSQILGLLGSDDETINEFLNKVVMASNKPIKDVDELKRLAGSK